jgi:ligand-binding SRPBCC domain-containing protein
LLNLLLDIFADALVAQPHRPVHGVTVIEKDTVVPHPLDHTFAFFSEATNLERLTPAWLNFNIRSQGPLLMREGLEIDYVISLRGLPIPWKTRIDVWEPGVRFVDRQTNGPYVWWRHEHRFEAVNGGTRVIDRVEFVPRLRWVTGDIVRRDVERIFEFRQDALKRVL